MKAKIEKCLDEITKAESVVRRVRFNSQKALAQFVAPEGANVERAVVGGRLMIRSTSDARPLTTYREYFKSIVSVSIRGMIVPPAKHNLRVSVGPVNVFFNWEGGDENLFSYGDRSASSRPSALTPGDVQTVKFEQQGENVIISVDGRKLQEGIARLEGTVTVYTYNSTIAIDEIVIEGVPDPRIGSTDHRIPTCARIWQSSSDPCPVSREQRVSMSGARRRRIAVERIARYAAGRPVGQVRRAILAHGPPPTLVARRNFTSSRRISMYSHTSVTSKAKPPYHSMYFGARARSRSRSGRSRGSGSWPR